MPNYLFANIPFIIVLRNESCSRSYPIANSIFIGVNTTFVEDFIYVNTSTFWTSICSRSYPIANFVFIVVNTTYTSTFCSYPRP